MNMDSLFYSRHQLRVFVEDLPRAFVETGFEIAEEPYIDYGLSGFRATYIRRYLLHQPASSNDGILTTIVHMVGIPFGHNGQKMVVLSAPRNLKNEPVADTLKLRLHFDENGAPVVVNNEPQVDRGKQQPAEQEQPSGSSNSNSATNEMACIKTRLEEHFIRNQHEYLSSIMLRNNQFDGRNQNFSDNLSSHQFLKDLRAYASHIVEVISPGLIELPIDMKLEILKQLSVESIIKMSQVNNEFRVLIFKHGESLWRHLCIRDFNLRIINRLVHKSWMELYRDMYFLHQVEICRKERALPGLPERLALPPVPYQVQIEPLPEVLELPFFPIYEELPVPVNPVLALEFHPLRRGDSLDSLR